MSSGEHGPVIDLCSPSSPPPPAKRLRTERKAVAPRLRAMNDEIVDLSLDSPENVHKQRDAQHHHQQQQQQQQQRQQHQPAAQAEPSRSLWGGFPSAEAGAGGPTEDAGTQLSERRLRRARRQFPPPLPPHLLPPQQPQQRHRQFQPGGGPAVEDSLSDDDLTFLGARPAEGEASTAPRGARGTRRRQYMPPRQLHANPNPQPPGSPPPADARADSGGARTVGSPRARKAQQDVELARRLQAQEELAAARAAQQARLQAHRDHMQQEYLQRRMDQLADLEAATGGPGGGGGWSDGAADDDDVNWDDAEEAMYGLHAARPWATGSRSAGRIGDRRSQADRRPRGRRVPPFELFPKQQNERGGAGGRQHLRQHSGASSLADAMLDMLSETGSWGGAQLPGADPGIHLHTHPHAGLGGQHPGGMGGAFAAMRAALTGMSSQSRLPPSMLFSDRDFNADDYEALLALDEGIDNRKGASKEVIQAIPTVTVGTGGGGLRPDDDPRCSICLADYASGATLRKLPCGHQFHRDCLDTWLTQKATCPICQANATGSG